MEALTHYKAVRHSCSRRWGCLTTVDLWPKTGRTHQLRRHMSGLGFPILGDKKYAKAYQILVIPMPGPRVAIRPWMLRLLFSRTGPICLGIR